MLPLLPSQVSGKWFENYWYSDRPNQEHRPLPARLIKVALSVLLFTAEAAVASQVVVSDVAGGAHKTDPTIDHAYGLLANDRFPEAIAAARLAIGQWAPQDAGRSAEMPWLTLIAAESEDGQDAQARADLQKFLATPRTLRTVADIQQSNLAHFATIRQLLDGLCHTGMPEE